MSVNPTAAFLIVFYVRNRKNTSSESRILCLGAGFGSEKTSIMITRINSVSFVRSIKTKKSEKTPLGLKAKVNKRGDYIWEEGVFMELDNGCKPDKDGRTGKIFDAKLNEVNDCWDLHEISPKIYLSELKIGKSKY